MGEGTKARIITGSLPEEVMDELDLVVISPECRRIFQSFRK